VGGRRHGRQAYDISVLFANADNPGNAQVQAILKSLPNVS